MGADGTAYIIIIIIKSVGFSGALFFCAVRDKAGIFADTMPMKRMLYFILPLCLVLCACSGAVGNEIYLVSREDGSGTRAALVQLADITDSDGLDAISQKAEITNNTSVMVHTVASCRTAVGYTSLASPSDGVRVLSVDGVYPTAQSISDGSYPLARTFYLVSYGEPDALAADFLQYVLSDEGQGIVSDCGYAAVGEGGGYSGGGLSGKLLLCGSSSCAPVAELLCEGYARHNPQVETEIQQSGSGAGISSVSAGICSLALSSRELTSEEKGASLRQIGFARDGIAVIVNEQNPLDNITTDELRQIFIGEIRYFSELSSYEG